LHRIVFISVLSYHLILKPAKRNDEESKPTVPDALCHTAILNSESCASSALTPGTPAPCEATSLGAADVHIPALPSKASSAAAAADARKENYKKRGIGDPEKVNKMQKRSLAQADKDAKIGLRTWKTMSDPCKHFSKSSSSDAAAVTLEVPPASHAPSFTALHPAFTFSYSPTLETRPLSSSLADFVRHRLDKESPSPVLMTSLEAGGEGDCLFHSIAAGLEQMLQDTSHNSEAVQFVLKRIPLRDFALGKDHMVQCLRNHVADRMRDLQDFELLDTLVSYMWQDNWRDGWNPAELLRRCGFEALQHATTVLAVQIHANSTDLTVKFEVGPEQQTPFIANGAVNLELLREEFGDQFRQCGDWHWGTQQDIIMLSEFLNIGFLVFTSKEQGDDQWIPYLGYTRSDFDYWMLLYWIDPRHYRLLQVKTPSCLAPASFFRIDELPSCLMSHFRLCNNLDIGSQRSSGVS
jgi:hypothetical protein